MTLFRSAFVVGFGRLVCYAWAGLLGFGASPAPTVVQPGDALTVHEWGTFTSIAGPGDTPVSWLPLSGPPDLPCFVNRLGGRSLKVASAIVRMETPVLYFYAPHPMSASVRVGFPQGLITEWYPRASVVQPSSFSLASGMSVETGSSIEWNSFDVLPDSQPKFPAENRPSHYYAARETDAASVRIAGQREKLIFYRGVGGFSVPLRAGFVDEGRLALRNAGPDPIPALIVFENRGGHVGYRRLGALDRAMTVEFSTLAGNVGSLRQEIEEILAAQGLYAKEARAMLETWRDSWFEEGTRVLYIVPGAFVDAVLPLAVKPAPVSLARVFVGRLEMLSPWMRREIETAVVAGDFGPLEKYGRFLQPFLDQVALTRKGLLESPPLREFLNAKYQRIQTELESPRACSE